MEGLAQAEAQYAKNPTATQKELIDYLRKEVLPMYAEKANVGSTYIDDAAGKVSGYKTMYVGNTAVQVPAGRERTLGKVVDQLNLQNNSKRIDPKALASLHDKLFDIIGNSAQKWDKEDAENREGMRKNMQELEQWKKWRTIDKDYLAKAQAASADMSFTDVDTYLYGLPGVLGSSASFNGLQWANTALSMAGGYLSSTGLGAAVGVPMIGAGYALGVESGRMENAAEVATAVEDSFQEKLVKHGEMDSFLKDAKKKLGKDVSYKDAMWAMALGEWEPSEKHKKEYVNSTFGANNLFKHDMMAVVGSNLIETTINVVPFGKFAKSATMIPVAGSGSKISKLRRLANFKQAHPTLYKNAEAFGNNLSEGWYNVGAAINPAVGAGFAAVGAATKPVRDKVVNTVAAPVTDALVKRFGIVADWAQKAPKAMMNTKTVGKYGADWVKRIGGSMWSESLEEGKQHYHAKEFAAGNYAGESDSMWEVLLGDIEGGSKSALQFTGSYLGLTSDEDWVVEMRSGALAGGGHTAVATGFANARNAVREVEANNLVINNILATKLDERATIEKGRAYASKIAYGDRRAMNQVFDNIKEIQHQITEQGERENNPEKVGISDEAIEEQRQMYNRIFNLANSEDMRQAAEERGIRPGTDKYATLVSLVNFAQQNGQEAVKAIQDKSSAIKSVISNSLFGIDNMDAVSDDRLLSIAQEKGIQSKRSSRPVFDEQAIEETRANRRSAFNNIINVVDYIAHLDALLTQRDQIELKDHKTNADTRKLRSINKQIDALRNSAKTTQEVTDEAGETKVVLKDTELSMINSAPELQKYVYDIDTHEVVRDQYRDISNYVIDLDNALAMQYNLIGKSSQNAVQINDQQLNDLISEIDSDLEKQYKATTALTDNKDVKIAGESISTINTNEKAAKKARKVIDDYINSVKADEEFEQRIHDYTASAIEELYGQPTEDTNDVSAEVAEESAEEPATKEAEPEQAQQEQKVAEEAKVEESPETVQFVPQESVLNTERKVEDAKRPNAEESQPEQTVKEQPAQEELEDMGDLQEYVDSFTLKSIPEDKIEYISQDVRSEINSVVDDLNSWIRDAAATKNKNEAGLVSSKDKSDLVQRYVDLINRANDVNEKADSEIKLAESIQSEPRQNIAD